MKKILFVCSGNMCRSPMAKVILEQMIMERRLGGKFVVDSVGRNNPSELAANRYAREAIRQLYGRDFLATHKPRSINEVDVRDFDLIITMEKKLKRGLPLEKTHTLREYADLEGDIPDPYNKSLETYIDCRDEIKKCLERTIGKIVRDC